jgi:hypothetical protein
MARLAYFADGRNQMLRIQVDEQPETTILRVEGKLAGDCVDELRRVWTAVRKQSPEKQAVVELSSVMTVDQPGRKLLSQMHSWGTQLNGKGLCIRSLIEEITGSS